MLEEARPTPVKPGRIRITLRYDHTSPISLSKAVDSAVSLSDENLEHIRTASVTQMPTLAPDSDEQLLLDALRELMNATENIQAVRPMRCRVCGQAVNENYSVEHVIQDGQTADIVMRCEKCVGGNGTTPVEESGTSDWRAELSSRDSLVLLLSEVHEISQRSIAHLLFPEKSPAAGQSEVSRVRTHALAKLSPVAHRALMAEAGRFAAEKDVA
jgi:hypothetical protein